MKLNWGHYILIAFVLFVGLILYMVMRSYQQNHDLVTENYYEKEIEFQDVINKKNKAAELEKNVTWKSNSGGVLVSFPLLDNEIKGEIVLFRPSDKLNDATFKIELDSLNQQHLTSEKVISGKYLIQIDWTAGNDNYFTEGTVFVKD